MTDVAAPTLPTAVTLRDFFAGQALQVLLPQAVMAQPDAIVRAQGQSAGQTVELHPDGVRWACLRAYNVADCLLGVREASLQQLEAARRAGPQSQEIVLPGPGSSNGHAGA